MVININPMFNNYSEHIQLWQKAGSEFRNLHLKKDSLPNRLPQNSEISPGAYIFQRPFLRGLLLEGLIFGGAYLSMEGKLRFKTDWACFTLYLRAIFKYKPPWDLCLEGRFNGGFLRYEFRAYSWRGLFSGGINFFGRGFSLITLSSA